MIEGRGSGDADAPGYLARATVALLTPISNAKVLAAICALNGCRCDVIEVPRGTLAIMVESRAGLADKAASGIAAFSKEAVVLAMERRDGQLTVAPWQGGVRGEELPPGLALDRAPESVVALMTGAITIEEMLAGEPGKVHSGRMGRWRAFWTLRRLARQGKRQLRV